MLEAKIMNTFSETLTGVLPLLIVAIVWAIIAISKYNQKKEIEERIAKIIQKSHGLLVDNRKHAIDYIWNILKPVHTILNREALVVVYLNEVNKIIDTDVCMGNATSVSYPTDEILDNAVNKRATKVILGHNHPRNYTTPSDQDVYHCSSLYSLLSSSGIQLMDDLVVCGVQLKSIMNTLRFKQIIKTY